MTGDQNIGFAYFALCDSEKSRGILKKMRGTVNAAEKLGFEGRLWTREGGRIRSYAEMVWALLLASEKYIMIRSLNYAGLVLLLPLLVLRLRGQYVIIDIPTPHRSVINEIVQNDQNIWIRTVKVMLLIISGPWSQWPANKLVQYAGEHPWFAMGNREKTLRMGNGIAVDDVPVRGSKPPRPRHELRLIGVANLAIWHGYDRVIRAIRDYHQQYESGPLVKFTIIGKGAEFESLQELADRLEVSDYVEFKGFMDGEELYAEYEQAHLAVASLGLFRIGLEEAGVLKAREYCSVGIPFIAAAGDPDFSDNLEFRIPVSNSEEVESIVRAFQQCIQRYDRLDIAEIRNYAESHLSFKEKLKVILELKASS